MKKPLQYVIALAILVCTTSFAQETTVDLSLGQQYVNEVYYKLDTQTETVFPVAAWDVAFLRNSSFNSAVRVNDGANIKVYEVANTPDGYDTVDVSNQTNWLELVNSDTNWEDGAFMQGSASFGFGEYNPVNHHIEGTIIYVLEYADGTYRKFFIEDYYGAYTFKYATWDGSNWSADTTEIVDNASNPDNNYNYYSLQNQEEVVGEPAATDWDFVFRGYTTYLNPPGQNYVVIGALHNPSVTVAQNEETGDPDPNGLTYSEEINTIGYDWKQFAGTWTVFSDQKFYVKYENNTVYRLYFTEYGGSSTGDVTFVYEDVTDLLGIEDLSNGVSFGMFPNPSSTGNVTVLYDLTATNTISNSIQITAMNGQVVLQTELSSQNGLYSKDLNVSNLQNGIYLVSFQSDNQTTTKKLIIK